MTDLHSGSCPRPNLPGHRIHSSSWSHWGEDFNILLITRLREEVTRLGHGDGTVIAVASTGRTLPGCGLVMAGTFGALLTARISVVQQVALVVAFGVLLDTFLIRPLLVLSIAEMLGSWNWVWPSFRRQPAQALDV